jgi:hypothetical protein
MTPMVKSWDSRSIEKFSGSPRWVMSQAIFAAIVRSQASSSEPMSGRNLNNNEITHLVDTLLNE